MRTISRMDMKDGYKVSSPYYFYNLEELIKKINTEDDPVDFRSNFLGVMQLYSDDLMNQSFLKKMSDLINFRNKEESDSSKQKVLSDLVLAGKDIIGSFYRGEDIDLDSVRNMISKNSQEIIGCGNKKKAKFRCLNNLTYRVESFGEEIQKHLDGKIDTVVCIANGAYEPSFLAMDILKKDDLVCVRYSNRAFKDSKVKLPKGTDQKSVLEKINGKNVLVVEDYMLKRISLEKVLDYVGQFEPSELYGASVIRTKNVESGVREGDILNSELPFICKYEISH